MILLPEGFVEYFLVFSVDWLND